MIKPTHRFSRRTIGLRPLLAAPRSLVVAAPSPSDVIAVAAAAPLDEDGDGLLEGVQGVLVGIRLSVDTWTPSEGGCLAHAAP